VPGTDPKHSVFARLILSEDRDGFYDAYAFNVSPVYDDSPFFFFTGRWKDTFSNMFAYDASGDAVNTGAQFLLVAILILAFVAVTGFIFGPLVLSRQRFPADRRVFPYLLFSLAVGLAYILVELALIHRFVVYLGQPVYSLVVVIFLLLLSSSLGSWVSRRLPEAELPRRGRLIIGGIVVLLALDLFLVPGLTSQTQSAPVAIKLALVACIVLPLGFLMGVPFPSGLRLAAATGKSVIEWSWAINAAATVLGSVLAIFIFVIAGISMGMALGALAYLVAAWLMARLSPEPLA
jgi:hypothetical protein